jgi:integrase
MKFDAKKVRLMAPGTEEPIDGFPGLRIAATTKRRSWLYRYKSPVTGTMKQTKLGEWPAVTLPAAIIAWESARASRASGVDLAMSKRNEARQAADSKPQAYSVRVLCDEYLAGHVEHARNQAGADNARRLIVRGIKPIATRDPGTITRAEAFALLSDRRESPVAAAKLRAELGAAWEYAIDSGRLAHETPNWWRQVMRGRLKSVGRVRAGERTKVKRVLTDAEVTALLAWLPHAPVAMRDAATLYLWTGTRGAEIMAMRGDEIARESDGYWWIVPKEKTKNKNVDGATDLRVPLVGRALRIVLDRQNTFGTGYLFPAVRLKGPMIQKTIQEMVYRCMPYSNVKVAYGTPVIPVTHWGLHDLRRTARTKLSALGCPRDIAEAVIGHVLGGVEGIYNLHHYDNERREWLTRLSDHWDSCAANQPSVIEQ